MARLVPVGERKLHLLACSLCLGLPVCMSALQIRGVAA